MDPSTGLTILGGAIFSLTGKRASKIPQEAIIGIAYVVAAAAAVLLLSRAAEGDAEIKQMLVGNILLVTPAEVWKCFALFVVVGIFHFLLRRNFFLVSFDRDRAYQGADHAKPSLAKRRAEKRLAYQLPPC